MFPPSASEAAEHAAAKDGEPSNETDRGAHILCRLLAGVFVVSLCNWEGPHPCESAATAVSVTTCAGVPAALAHMLMPLNPSRDHSAQPRRGPGGKGGVD
jgi:hypothetical protein